MGLEAMAQASLAVARTTAGCERPLFENVEFIRPVVVPDDGPATIRGLSHR